MKLNIKKQLPVIAGLAAGGIATGYVNKLVPIENAKIKAGIPLVLGVLLSGQKGFMGNVGLGMITAGAVNLAGSFGIGAVDETIIGTTYIDEEDLSGVDTTILAGSEGVLMD